MTLTAPAALWLLAVGLLAGGVVDFYASDHKPLFPDLTKEKFTYQMSDHLPLWVQIRTDIDGFILDQLIQRKRAQ